MTSLFVKREIWRDFGLTINTIVLGEEFTSREIVFQLARIVFLKISEK